MAGKWIWYELMTSDLDGARRFYSSVMGWHMEDKPSGDMEYFMISTEDSNVGGFMKIPEDAAKMGMPPSWQCYIAVADVDATVAAIIADGGKCHMPKVMIPGIGAFAMVGDPQAASFYVMTPDGEGESRSFEPGTPGHCAWNELHARDGDAALAFYEKHFGWNHLRDFEMGPMGKYHIFSTDGAGDAGGIMSDASFPHPAWLFYFRVEEIEAAAARVTAAGGTILFGPSEVPGGGWIINGRDPQGGMFSLTGPKK